MVLLYKSTALTETRFGFIFFLIGEEEDEKLLEDLEDKQLRQRITALENENSNVKEQIWKLEHGRNWMENRLTAMEGELQSLKVDHR